MSETRTTFSISLPRKTADQVEKARKRLGMTRSEFFRALLRQDGRFPDPARTAQEGKSFEFLKDEPDLYSAEDVAK